jgi:Protein kinase domain
MAERSGSNRPLDLVHAALQPRGGGAESALEALDLADPAQRRLGDYELLECIGRGGMGVVFRARQVSLDREVALKVVATPDDDEDAAARFLHEARAVAQLHHPHIVPVYETGLLAGEHFFSMPLLRGASLAARLQGRALPLREALDLAITLAGAVGYAHSLGLLHLDLKPANVLLDAQGRALIADFGLARALEPLLDAGAHSGGTPAYMAPEQRDPALGPLSPRSDIHALGAMLHEFLTGQPPLPGAVRSGTDVPGTDLPAPADADLAAICRCCLAADPAQRYATVADLVADLTRCRDGNEVSVRPRRWPERLRRSLRRHPALSTAIAAALLALLVGLAATAWQWQRAEAALREAHQARAQSSARAERLRQLAGLMAASFPAGATATAERERSAQAAIAWLRRETGGDSAAQRELLTAFSAALRTAGQQEAVDTLLRQIIEQLGQDYRQEQLRQLLQRGDRDSLIAAVLSGAGHEADAAQAGAAAAQLYRAYGQDTGALYALALACHAQSQPCSHKEYFTKLTAQAPNNAAHWLLLPAGQTEDTTQTAARLAQAARASHFDDYSATHARLLRQSLPEPQLPDRLRAPLQALVDEGELTPSLRRNAVDATPLPRFADFVALCRPDTQPAARFAALRGDCDNFARLILQSPRSSILAYMIAVTMQRRLHKGTALDEQAKALRRQYVWLAEQFARQPVDAEQLQRDFAAYGEWQAWLRAADRAGIARNAPPDWQPQQPQTLLLPEERR